MARDLKGAQERAEARFNKQKDRANEGKLALAEYQAEVQAMLDKTARLRSLRLAKEAADREEAIKQAAVKQAAPKVKRARSG